MSPCAADRRRRACSQSPPHPLTKVRISSPGGSHRRSRIVAGETRYKAAVLIGLTAAPVVTIPARQARAFRVIDNRTSELTSWDTDLLPDALSGLDDLDIFSFDDVFPPAGTAGKTDPDDIPETPKKPITRTGDLWVLGKHRIVCGDSTNQETVERLLDGAEPDLMVTDPPYGVNYDSSWRYKAGISTKDGAFGKSANDDQNNWQAAYVLFPGRIAYVWMSSLALPVAASGLDACGFIPRSLIIWDKGRIVIGRGHYHWRHEACWYAVKKGAQAHWKGGRKASTLWEIDNPGNPRRATRPKSRSSVCSGLSTTIGATSTIRSSGRAPRSSLASRRGAPSMRSRSSLRTSM